MERTNNVSYFFSGVLSWQLCERTFIILLFCNSFILIYILAFNVNTKSFFSVLHTSHSGFISIDRTSKVKNVVPYFSIFVVLEHIEFWYPSLKTNTWSILTLQTQWKERTVTVTPELLYKLHSYSIPSLILAIIIRTLMLTLMIFTSLKVVFR